MAYTPSAPVHPLRAVLLGLTAGAGAALLALLLGQITVPVAEFLSGDVVGANIGAGLAGVAVTVLAVPLMAWPLLRLCRLPYPFLTALGSLPLQVIMFFPVLALSSGAQSWLWARFPAFAEATSPVVPYFALDFLASAFAVALPALLASRVHAGRTPAPAPSA